MTFDPNKPVKQRNGRPARIICKDAKGDYPIIVLIDYGNEERAEQYPASGKFYPNAGESAYDLIERLPDTEVSITDSLKTTLTLGTINSKLDELLRRDNQNKIEIEGKKTLKVLYRDINGEEKEDCISTEMNEDEVFRLYRNSGYNVWSVT